MSTHIDEPVAEASDYLYETLIVGDDGETPIDIDSVTAMLLTIRDVESGVLIETDLNVFAGLIPDPLADPDVNFRWPITAAQNASQGADPAPEMQLRLMTFKITHSAGRKRNQEITYYLDNMQDAP